MKNTKNSKSKTLATALTIALAVGLSGGVQTFAGKVKRPVSAPVTNGSPKIPTIATTDYVNTIVRGLEGHTANQFNAQAEGFQKNFKILIEAYKKEKENNKKQQTEIYALNSRVEKLEKTIDALTKKKKVKGPRFARMVPFEGSDFLWEPTPNVETDDTSSIIE